MSMSSTEYTWELEGVHIFQHRDASDGTTVHMLDRFFFGGGGVVIVSSI